MKKAKRENLKKGSIYFLENYDYRKPEFDKFIFKLIDLKGDIIVIKDFSSDKHWASYKGITDITFISSDKIYKISEKELMARLI